MFAVRAFKSAVRSASASAEVRGEPLLAAVTRVGKSDIVSSYQVIIVLSSMVRQFVPSA